MPTSETVHRMIDDLPQDLRQEAIHYTEEIVRWKKTCDKEVQPGMGRGGSPISKAAPHPWNSSTRHVSDGIEVYLLDTNIFFELLLDQNEAASVRTLFNTRVALGSSYQRSRIPFYRDHPLPEKCSTPLFCICPRSLRRRWDHDSLN